MQRKRGSQQNEKVQKCLQKTRDTKGTLHRDGLNKNQNSMDLTEAEYIKKRLQEYTEELYKKDLLDPDNHDGSPRTSILECKFMQALGSITKKKASGGDQIPAQVFQILKNDA